MVIDTSIKVFTLYDTIALLVLLGLSYFNGCMIALFSQYNVFWSYIGILFFSASFMHIFIIIYSSSVYVFRSSHRGKIYGYREFLWNILILVLFFLLSLVFIRYTFNKPIVNLFLPLVLVSSIIVFYLTIYFAMLKPKHSLIDKAMVRSYIWFIYFITWLYIVISSFNVLMAILSLIRISGVYIHEILIIEKTIIDNTINESTGWGIPLTILTITFLITFHDYSKPIRIDKQNIDYELPIFELLRNPIPSITRYRYYLKLLERRLLVELRISLISEEAFKESKRFLDEISYLYKLSKNRKAKGR